MNSVKADLPNVHAPVALVHEEYKTKVVETNSEVEVEINDEEKIADLD